MTFGMRTCSAPDDSGWLFGLAESSSSSVDDAFEETELRRSVLDCAKYGAVLVSVAPSKAPAGGTSDEAPPLDDGTFADDESEEVARGLIGWRGLGREDGISWVGLLKELGGYQLLWAG